MVESNPRSAFNDRFIDRLVDGEVSAAELRAAVDSLDRSPDGWKRCALAFLEAQCWHRSLEGTGLSANSCGESLIFSAKQNETVHHGRWIRTAVAATVVVVSFSFGWAGHAVRQPVSNAQNPTLLDSAKIAPSSLDVHAKSLDPRSHPDLVSDADPSEPHALEVARQAIRSVGHVRVGSESAGADIPILAGPGIDETWLRNQPPPLTEEGEIVLQQQGYQVDQRRQLISTTLADGRRVAIPVDQVQIRYVGNHPL